MEWLHPGRCPGVALGCGMSALWACRTDRQSIRCTIIGAGKGSESPFLLPDGLRREELARTGLGMEVPGTDKRPSPTS